MDLSDLDLVMSFDLVVLAMSPDATATEARAMAERCEYHAERHPEGDIDPRIATFYQQLTWRFPDGPPYPDRSPWSSMPLTLGIDHVIMYMCLGEVSDPVVPLVMSLAQEHRLVVYDGHGDDVYLPDGTMEPSAARVQSTPMPLAHPRLGYGLGGLLPSHEDRLA